MAPPASNVFVFWAFLNHLNQLKTPVCQVCLHLQPCCTTCKGKSPSSTEEASSLLHLLSFHSLKQTICLQEKMPFCFVTLFELLSWHLLCLPLAPCHPILLSQLTSEIALSSHSPLKEREKSNRSLSERLFLCPMMIYNPKLHAQQLHGLSCCQHWGDWHIG